MVVGIAAAGFSAVKFIPAIGGAALKVLPAIGLASAGAGKLAATVATGVKAATAIVGIGKLAIIPVLIAALAYYHYDVFDPENRPFNIKDIDHEYDFIIVGSGAGGSVVGKLKINYISWTICHSSSSLTRLYIASRLSEIGNWKVLLLEAGGHETEISDVPILSLYLHKSKLDWKYR
jgi:choline dehydrogenase